MDRKCNNCQKDLTTAPISKYNENKDLLICPNCWDNERYKDYEISKEIECIVIFDYEGK
jgi:uncharacterized CHY-type Zn-finger protein